MKIKVVSLIRKQEASLAVLESDYVKRIQKMVPVELAEIRRDAILNEADKKRIFDSESKKILKAVKPDSSLVILDSKGKEMNSDELAKWLDQRMQAGEKELAFVLGGPLGLAEELREKAKWKISLSKLTLPHKLARVVLLESLYRSLNILKGGSYHK